MYVCGQQIQMRKVLNAKFCVIFVELIVVSCIFFTKFENIAASNSQGVAFSSMVNYTNGFAAISLLMIAVQLLASLLGLPFNKSFVPLQVTLQVVGLFLYGCFIVMRMQFQTISYIWGVFCLIPFALDVAGVLTQTISNRKYALLDSK